MYPSTNDFDPYADYPGGGMAEWRQAEIEEELMRDYPETEVIAGVEIRGSEAEDDWDGEELQF